MGLDALGARGAGLGGCDGCDGCGLPLLTPLRGQQDVGPEGHSPKTMRMIVGDNSEITIP